MGLRLQVRIIKLLRLLKLTRVLKASTIMKRIEATMEFTYAAMAMTKLLVFMVAWCHLQAPFRPHALCTDEMLSLSFCYPHTCTPSLSRCRDRFAVKQDSDAQCSYAYTSNSLPIVPSPAVALSPSPQLSFLRSCVCIRPCAGCLSSFACLPFSLPSYLPFPFQACLWGMLPQFESGYTWIKGFNASHYSDHGETASPLSPWDLYVASFYHSAMTVTGIGYGEMLPVTTFERTISSVLMLVSGELRTSNRHRTCHPATSPTVVLAPMPIAFQLAHQLDALPPLTL